MKAVRREMLVQQLQKLFGNINGDITTEQWIKPYDVPTALLFRVGRDQWLVFQVVIIANLFQCIIILSLDSSKTSSLEEFFENLSLMILGSCFIICGGWLELFLCVGMNHLGWSVPLLKLNVISRKLTIFRQFRYL